MINTFVIISKNHTEHSQTRTKPVHTHTCFHYTLNTALSRGTPSCWNTRAKEGLEEWSTHMHFLARQLLVLPLFPGALLGREAPVGYAQPHSLLILQNLLLGEDGCLHQSASCQQEELTLDHFLKFYYPAPSQNDSIIWMESHCASVNCSERCFYWFAIHITRSYYSDKAVVLPWEIAIG